ncbi:MAG: sugar ABC transporter ATP-binding protein [Geminicoccaceae bacterium]
MTGLALTDIVKTFPGVRALDGVTLRAAPGSIHALLGENGAGKSTLIKIIAGVHQADSGHVAVDGREVAFTSPRLSMAAGIAVVHQERNLIPRFSIAENILLERLPASHGILDRRAMEAEATTWMEVLELDLDPRTPVRELGVAHMQLVEIAKALALRAHILLLDEPTASLTPHEADTLFRLLRRFRDEGVAIVFVSHKLEEVLALCDRVTVLRDGRNACADEPMANLARADLVRWMIGREETRAACSAGVPASGPPALELRKVSTDLGHEGIDLTVRSGEIVGLYGLVGAGRSELAKAIIGAEKVTAGEILVRGTPVRIGSVAEALAKYRIGYVSEDRKQEGVILQHSVAGNITVTIWTRLAKALGFLTGSGERAAATPFARQLEVKTPSLSQPVGLLSGGNQQKVSVAKWLAAGVDVLIVDEPTVGIDIKTKADLHALLRDLAAKGTAILLISSDMPEMVALADRILVLGSFRIVGEVAGGQDYTAASDAIMAAIHRAED